MIPPGWTFDPDYEDKPTWWHDDCPTPTTLDDGSQLGGLAYEERSASGHLVAVVCGDCDDCFSISRRPDPDDAGT